MVDIKSWHLQNASR